MKKQVSEKEYLLTTLAKMNKQLQELDSVLEASLSDLRSYWLHEEAEKLAACGKGVSFLENRLKKINSLKKEENKCSVKKQNSPLKFDLSFH